MAGEQTSAWQEIFTKWPANLPKRGIVVSTLNEANPFKSFLVKGGMLLLERTNPDAMGARYIVMDFGAIHMVKLTEPTKEDVFTSNGFVGHFAKM
jgi:hypothetical protein